MKSIPFSGRLFGGRGAWGGCFGGCPRTARQMEGLPLRSVPPICTADNFRLLSIPAKMFSNCSRASTRYTCRDLLLPCYVFRINCYI